MKFLADVNASGALALWLAEMGHDVVRVAERDPRMPDDEILSWAVAEERVIVTTDRDFEEMIWRDGKAHRGVLRLENLPRVERKALLCRLPKSGPFRFLDKSLHQLKTLSRHSLAAPRMSAQKTRWRTTAPNWKRVPS